MRNENDLWTARVFVWLLNVERYMHAYDHAFKYSRDEQMMEPDYQFQVPVPLQRLLHFSANKIAKMVRLCWAFYFSKISTNDDRVVILLSCITAPRRLSFMMSH